MSVNAYETPSSVVLEAEVVEEVDEAEGEVAEVSINLEDQVTIKEEEVEVVTFTTTHQRYRRESSHCMAYALIMQEMATAVLRMDAGKRSDRTNY